MSQRSGAARRAAVVLAFTLFVASCGSDSQGPPAGTLTPIGAGIRGPADLRASKFAGGLLHVAALAVDPEGRVWASTATFEDEGTDAVYVIPRAGARPKKVITGQHTPLGLLWHGGTLYVSSHSRVETFTGFDGTSFAEHRTIVRLPSNVGENNGLTMSPAGRILLGISSPCDSCTPTLRTSAAVVSFRPDGTDLRVEASGIRAPIALAYFPGTSDLFVTMNQRDDLGAKTPGDWLAIVRHGQAWGFPACYGQGGSACTGAPDPVAVLDKHAAVSGLAMVTGGLGASVGTSAVVAEWAFGKVQRVALDKTGSTYRAQVEPFLTGLKHPVPVLMTKPSTLIVGDWGTGILYQVDRR